jgi:hypothetical protein
MARVAKRATASPLRNLAGLRGRGGKFAVADNIEDLLPDAG